LQVCVICFLRLSLPLLPRLHDLSALLGESESFSTCLWKQNSMKPHFFKLWKLGQKADASHLAQNTVNNPVVLGTRKEMVGCSKNKLRHNVKGEKVALL